MMGDKEATRLTPDLGADVTRPTASRQRAKCGGIAYV
jgi:hypothetical protein